MSRISEVIRSYSTTRAVIGRGVDIFAIGDPPGAMLDAAMREIRFHIEGDDTTAWDQLLYLMNILRWRRITEPQPNRLNPQVAELGEVIKRESAMLRNFVDAEMLLTRVESAIADLAGTDSPVGAELRRSILEVGPGSCVVLASRSSARAGIAAWLSDIDAKVLVPSELDTLPAGVDLSFVVGPPIFRPRGLFPVGLVTAPQTSEVTFLQPSWFVQRQGQRERYAIPRSNFSEYAEGSITIQARVFEIGDSALPEVDVPGVGEDPNLFFPEPVWGTRTSGDREPLPDEVEAWKLVLAGGLGLWLDDGERIRSLDPKQPVGARIEYEAVDDVGTGTYLVLRDGETEHDAMYAAALAEVKDRAAWIRATQDGWKSALAGRLQSGGVVTAIAQLAQAGVRSATRVRAWVEPTLISPKRADDLAKLLDWLGIPKEPTYSNALELRRALYRASADLGRELEGAIGRADLNELELSGTMHLDLQRDGFRGMIVARVIGRAPFTEIVARQKTRIPFPDGSAKWLE